MGPKGEISHFLAKLVLAIMVLFAEIYSFIYFVRDGSMISGGLNLALNASLWESKQVFVYSFSWIFFVIFAIVLILLLKDEFLKFLKHKKEEVRNLEKKYLLYHAIFFALFLSLNYSIWQGSPLNYYLLLAFWYVLILCFSSSLFIFVFGSKEIFRFISKHKTDILGSLFISYIFVGTYFLLSKVWYYLSSFVGKSIYFLLKIFYEEVRYQDFSSVGSVVEKAPTIGVGDFNALIVRECAGIEGISLFLFLFTLIVIVDYKKLDFRKVILLYLVGILGMVALNIIRIFILILIGIEVSGSFAVDVAHSNLGWLLFGLFFFVFLYFFYDWMLKPKYRKIKKKEEK